MRDEKFSENLADYRKMLHINGLSFLETTYKLADVEQNKGHPEYAYMHVMAQLQEYLINKGHYKTVLSNKIGRKL